MPFALPVLMYHSISRFKHHLCVTPERFEEHCRVLAEAGWRGIPLAEAEDYFLKKKRLPKKTCLLTFDDGYFDNYVFAEPLLRSYGHHGALFPVLNFVESGTARRPNLESLEKDGGAKGAFTKLDSRRVFTRRGRRVVGIVFCNWAELRHMRENGNMTAAPHSMRHGRVVRDLTVRKLYWPGGRSNFFAVPPHELPYGFPYFKLGHALVDRGYRLVPELFELVRTMVPQEISEAKAFLRKRENYEAVLRAVRALPRLGVLESEAEYRSRIAAEFAGCRELFTEKMGYSPVSFCWPWGRFSRMALEEARKAGFRLFFATGGLPSCMSGARAVYRISVRGQTGRQLLHRLRFASGAVGEGLLGLLHAG